jgi:hypothetical protein
VNPLTYSQFLLWTGDLCFVAGLVLMAVLSAGAAKSIDPSTQVPMQFGRKGRPTWSAPRRFALLFAPVLAAICGLFLTYLAHHDTTDGLTRQALSLGLSRVAMALCFVVTHALHLAIVVHWLNRQK